jgi:hypothetical protein
MFYKKYLFFTILSFIYFLPILQAQNRELPAQVFTPKTPFLTKIIENKALSTKIFMSKSTEIIPTTGPVYQGVMQELIKAHDTVYILLERTGVVFVMDPAVDTSKNYSFHRIDQTININYNIECNNFLYKNRLYSYGGYGFWKMNGLLRSFNFSDKEWDIVPVNEEIISNGYNWVDLKVGKLYVPFQSFSNAGIKIPLNNIAQRRYDSYCLDLNLMEWKKLGTLSNKAKALVKDNSIINTFLTTNNGFLYNIDDDVYFFDFIHNSIFKSKNTEFNQYILRRSTNTDIYFFNDTLYNYANNNKGFDQRALLMSDFTKLNFPIWGLDNNYYYLVALIFILAIIITFFIWLYKKMLRKKIQQSNLKILKTKTVGQAFIGSELSLIQLLLEAASKDMHVEINQINHVLGIKDKNIGLQKKVRSDVINTINEKYAIIVNANIPLISSIRKEEDKRFYEYFINEEEIKSIKKILDKK